MATETSQTLDRGLQVLELLAQEPEGLTVTALAAALGISRTVVYRLVVTLEGHGLVRRGADGRARLGMSILALARGLPPSLSEAVATPLRRLAEQTAATAHLTVVDGPDALVVSVSEPLRPEGVVAIRPGLRRPYDRTAAGRAVMAARQPHADEVSWMVAGPEVGTAASRFVEVAVALVGVHGIDGAVGVVTAETVDPQILGPLVVRAAAEVSRALR